FFFFQAEDGIRDRNVTGVQTCALPIFRAQERAGEVHVEHPLPLVSIEEVRRSTTRDPGRGDDGVDSPVLGDHLVDHTRNRLLVEIGRASCRERGWSSGGAAVVTTTELG